MPRAFARARRYAPPVPVDGGEPRLPRVFISEVDVSALSGAAQDVIAKYAARAAALAPQAAVSSLLRTPLWGAAERGDFETLAAESEYAAWVLVNGFALNHATVAVHRMGAATRSIEAVNALIAEQVRRGSASERSE
jgi:hypothetical protein